ncbi:spindle and kinetochore-associated protein 3 [Phaenicophaeus curvirostris]|uniref:spindle and kinetochore-associated protein 3 n=1 Tax=Phaenicophaeus curvirostris TaxID=33595 RepID=UPI0037F0F7F4
MDVSKVFFRQLRDLASTVEKEVRQLEQALNREDTDYEVESPTRLLHDLHCEIKTLKKDVSASLDKCCSEEQAIHDFLKASEILMQRNAADLGKIRELLGSHGCKPHGKDSTGEEEKEVKSDLMVYAQNKSDEEKLDVPHLPASAEKPPLPEDSLRVPQLSDFGLTQYAFSKPWSAGKKQHATNAYQKNSKNRTPVTPRTSSVLPKTPKCMLKMDDYERVTPKLEQFGISEHTMCLNEDYTISLIHKTAQSVKQFVKDKVNASEMTSKEIMVTPRPKPKVAPENADWMVSPMVFVFCTPDVKTPSRKNETVLSKSPQPNELPLPSHTETPQLPKFEARWLKPEAKEVKQSEKIESMTKNGATDKQYKEDRVPFAVSSDAYLDHFGDPCPPKIKQYDQLSDTPPPPEITRIPDDVLQILSKYNHNVDSSKDKKMDSEAGNATRYENDFTDYCDKENRGLSGIFKTKI